MKSAIEELIFENGSYMENICHNDECWQLLDECDKLYKKLKESLNGEQLELLDKLLESHMRIEVKSCDSHLLKGFKTGVKLVIECL